MAEPNKLQLEIFDKIKRELCGGVDLYPVGGGAIEVSTPFLDWNGSEVSVFITKEGRITDGGEIISQMQSLKIIDDFDNWPFKLDFLHRYNIDLVRGCLEPNNISSSKNIVRYIQGITRLLSYFEPKPIYDTSQQYPYKVRKMTKEALLPYAPTKLEEAERILWAAEFIKERPISLNGIEVRSDMSPRKYFRMIQIISHATSAKYVKKQHVDAKVLYPVLLKREEQHAEVYFIVEDLRVYPPESRKLLRQESQENIIETIDTGAQRQIGKIMIEE
jgi:hypothetical protein